MRKACDWCKRPVKEVGKLFKQDYLMLCKDCRDKYKAKNKRGRVRGLGKILSIFRRRK